MRTVGTLVVTVVLALSAGSALAAPEVSGVFDMKGVQTNGQLVAGPDGNIWVALEGAVARVTPDGTVTELTSVDSPKLGSPAGGITAADGAIWVSQPPSGVQSIVKITPGDPPVVESFPVTDVDTGATAMTLGPDGNIWVGIAGKLVKFPPSPDPTQSTVYPFPLLQPKAITASPDGTLWVTDTANGGRLLNVKTDGTLVQDPYVVGGTGFPQFLAAGPNHQIVYGNPTNDPQQIGQLTAGGTPQTFDRPIPADPFGVAFGGDGAFWVAMFAGHRLDRITTDGKLTSLDIPDAVSTRGPRHITAGPNNTLWATLDNPGLPATSKIAKITGVAPPPPTDTTPPPPPPPPPDTTKPVLSAVGLSKTKVRVGTKTVTLRFTLSEAGTAKVVLSRRVRGRRHGKACVKATHKLRRARRCTRLVRLKTIQVAAVAGQNAIALSLKGRPAGSYSVALTVTDAAGNAATAVTRTLTIAKKRR